MSVAAVTLIVLAAQAIIYGFMLWQMIKTSEATAKAAKATEDSVALARENAHLDQRAWVAPAGAFTAQGVSQPTTVAILLKNTGKTFAKRCFVSSQLVVKRITDPDPDFDGLVKNLDRIELGTIAPNQQTKSPSCTIDVPLNTPTVITLIFGKVSYKDVFEREHWTTFCYRVREGSVGGIVIRPVEVEAYGSYNDTDD